MPKSFEEAAADYATEVTDWAVTQAAKLWRRMQPDRVQYSWAKIAPPLLDVHRALVVGALDNVDLMMVQIAADAGFVWAGDWEQDQKDRPDRVYWGQPSRAALSRAPVVVLQRLAAEDAPDVALLRGWNYLSGIYRTEAHRVLREVSLQRVEAGS